MNAGPHQSAAQQSGVLVLVVGPSGAGKDTLLNGARGVLSAADYMFPRREITRPSDEGGEEHIPIDMDTFRVRCVEGAYGLFWRAHGLGYGLPLRMDDWLAEGRLVAVNASRSVVAQARDRYARVAVVTVTAPPAVLTARLTARGREAADDIARRVARAAMPTPRGPGVYEVMNDGREEQAIQRFVSLLERLHATDISLAADPDAPGLPDDISRSMPHDFAGRDATSR